MDAAEMRRLGRVPNRRCMLFSSLETALLLLRFTVGYVGYLAM